MSPTSIGTREGHYEMTGGVPSVCLSVACLSLLLLDVRVYDGNSRDAYRTVKMKVYPIKYSK